MKTLPRLAPARFPRAAFSLVELLVVIVVLGIVMFFAFPNIVQMRSDSEDSLARARAEMLNLAVAAYFQAVGDRATAKANWAAAGSDSARYTSLLKPYIAFPPASLSAFMPSSDYTVVFDPTDPLVNKVQLYGPGGQISY
ncbi:MAG: prepilin-type N-terminal cleavage/methylation domain-containing protein [Chthoniobacterales bacterium]